MRGSPKGSGSCTCRALWAPLIVVAMLAAACGSGSDEIAATTTHATTAVAGPTTATSTATSTVIPPTTQLLGDDAWFASNWDSDGIRLTHRDGSSSIEVLTDLPAGATSPWNPDWSPSGDQLVANISTDPSGAILISDLDDGRQKVIACEAPCLGYGAPSWYRDGKRIAYAQADESGLKITVFDVESESASDVLEMNEQGVDIDQVRWSPTGEELVGIRSAALVVMSVADGSVREIIGGNERASYPDWHPTQDMIVFSTYGLSEFGGRLAGHASNLFTVRSDGSELTQITDFPPGGTRAGQATWSPDGTFIVFTLATGTNNEIPHIATIAPDGTDLTDLGAPGTHNRLRPAP